MYGYLRCPACAEMRARRSAYRIWERAFSLFTDFRPYRCEACGWRKWCRVNGYALRPVRSALRTVWPF